MGRDSDSGSSSSSSEEERKTKKHKKEKKEKKKKHKKGKKEKKSKKSSKEKMLEEALKMVQKKDKGKKIGRPDGIGDISEKDDFFSKANDFRVWAKREKDTFVGDLSGEETRELFGKFVKKWNKGALEEMYYTGCPQEVLENTQRTKHTWGFVSKMSEDDKMALASLKDAVDKSTNPNAPPSNVAPPTHNRSSSSSMPPPPRKELSRADREDERSHLKMDRKRMREHSNMVMEELAPRATGREAMIEKKKAKGAQNASFASEKASGGDMDVSESTLMGGSGNDFKEAVARRNYYQQKKKNEKMERGQAARAKEDKTMDAFMNQLGLKPGQRIQIAERRD